VLLRKQRSHGEVYNDLDSDVVNIFRILQHPARAAELARRITLTTYSRQEFKAAYAEQPDDMGRAWSMIVRAFMGFGSASMTRMHITGFRANASRNGTIPAEDWKNWPSEIQAFVHRLRGVVIENREAIEVMLQHDHPLTLHYVDPPYPEVTRSSLLNKNGNRGHYYRHDMDDGAHRRLATALRELSGMVVLSGYPCALYDEDLYPDWQRFEKPHLADGARPRTEVLWLNPACSAALERSRSQPRLIT
jgi:DNA adenine methylase